MSIELRGVTVVYLVMFLKFFTVTINLASLAFAASYKRVTCPDGVHTATNDACCVFFSLADELQTNVFNHTCFETGKPLRLQYVCVPVALE